MIPSLGTTLRLPVRHRLKGDDELLHVIPDVIVKQPDVSR
jgi:hypothetical protein